MNAFRSHSLAGYAVGSLKSLGQLPVDTTGVAVTGAAAAVAWAFGSANIPILWVVGCAMLGDLVVGAMKAVVDPLEDFSIARLYGGLLGKIFRSLLIPIASLVDWLYIVSPLPLPDGYEAAFPVTSLVMLGLAAAEITSTLAKFKEGGVSPSLIAAIIRHLDRIKGGQEPPARRHYDPPAIAAERDLEEGRSPDE